MQILVATLRGAAHQQQHSAASAALLPSLVLSMEFMFWPRDGAVRKIFVRKLHHTAQFCPHTAPQKICKLVAPQILSQVKI